MKPLCDKPSYCKNDKPAISRAIVKNIRDNNGKFLKKDEKSGLWFEIGDDAAREKTSQALRQRAPEMRKLLFDTEREEARVAAEEHLRQQRMLVGMSGSPGSNEGGMPNMANPMLNPAFMAMAMQQQGGSPGQVPPNPEAYAQMMAGMMQGNIPRFPPPAAASPGATGETKDV